MNDLTKLNILITGCSSGFGKLTAQTLAKAGHRVFASMRSVHGKNAKAARQLQDWAKGEGLSLEVVELDVTDQASVDKAVTRILEAAGHLDVVVNNAGVANVGILEGFTIEQTQALFDVNTFGALRVDKAVLPSMRARKSGLLIHISSGTGRVVIPFLSPYSAAKFALEALAEEFHYQLVPFGIESVVIEPGSFGTEVFDKLVMPADNHVLAGYGELAAKPQQMFAGIGGALSGPDAPNPQAVADAIKNIIDKPGGERPLRTVVGPLMVDGVEPLNRAYEESKKEMLTAIGAA